MKLIYASGRGWARVGETWTTVDDQDKANVNAKVFNGGNAIVLSDVEWDVLKSTYTGTPA